MVSPERGIILQQTPVSSLLLLPFMWLTVRPKLHPPHSTLMLDWKEFRPYLFCSLQGHFVSNIQWKQNRASFLDPFVVLPVLYILLRLGATPGPSSWFVQRVGAQFWFLTTNEGRKISVLCVFQSFSEGRKRSNHYVLKHTILNKHAVEAAARIFCCIRCFHYK